MVTYLIHQVTAEALAEFEISSRHRHSRLEGHLICK